MLFHLKSNSEFEANDIVDAFEKLKEHFKKLTLGEESDLITGGYLEVYRCSKENNES